MQFAKSSPLRASSRCRSVTSEASDFTVENGFEVGFCWRADLVPCVTGELRVDGVGVLPPVIGNGVKAAFFQESFAVSGECLEGVV